MLITNELAGPGEGLANLYPVSVGLAEGEKHIPAGRELTAISRLPGLVPVGFSPQNRVPEGSSQSFASNATNAHGVHMSVQIVDTGAKRPLILDLGGRPCFGVVGATGRSSERDTRYLLPRIPKNLTSPRRWRHQIVDSLKPVSLIASRMVTKSLGI